MTGPLANRLHIDRALKLVHFVQQIVKETA